MDKMFFQILPQILFSEETLNVNPHLIPAPINTIVFQILGPTNKSTSPQEQMRCTSFQIDPNLR